ncbi:Tetratricopeptide repeat protein 29 [Pteropus alecto]|uniref:Tetratricopeptide repeat protein 29 n=1 Tax=Pteropus alecto TaxID=9402 RepID=L5L1A5_PTEAL|nr:Tetratricopeptide repeat protein 29 [Pteropus alecto]
MRCQASALETRDRDDLGVLSRTKLLNEGIPAWEDGRAQEAERLVFNTYGEISTNLDDDLSLGRAYEAIARVLQSQGEMTEAIKYLKKVVKISQNNFQWLDVVRASTMLGDIYNKKGCYNKASEYFQQAFDTTAELTNIPLMDETKVHYGIAKAHQMMRTVSNYVESADLASLDYLLSWKESRSDIALDPVVANSSCLLKITDLDVAQ